MGYTLGVDEALDLIEGIVGGAVVGLGAFLIAGAAASLPASFLPASSVNPISVITGALTFVGISIHSIRKRNASTDAEGN